MKKIIFLLIGCFSLTSIYAQKTLNIHKNDSSVENFIITSIDSIRFSEDESIMLLYAPELISIPLAGIDSVTITIPSAQMFSLTLTSDEGGSVESARYSYLAGEDVTVTAIADEGYNFTGWLENGGLISEDLVYTFIMPERDVILHGSFEAIPPTRVSFVISKWSGEGQNIAIQSVDKITFSEDDLILNYISDDPESVEMNSIRKITFEIP